MGRPSKAPLDPATAQLLTSAWRFILGSRVSPQGRLGRALIHYLSNWARRLGMDCRHNRLISAHFSGGAELARFAENLGEPV